MIPCKHESNYLEYIVRKRCVYFSFLLLLTVLKLTHAITTTTTTKTNTHTKIITYTYSDEMESSSGGTTGFGFSISPADTVDATTDLPFPPPGCLADFGPLGGDFFPDLPFVWAF